MKQNLRAAHIFSNFAPNRGGPGRRDHCHWQEIEADVTGGGLPLVDDPDEQGDSLCLYVMLVEKTHEVGEPKRLKISGVSHLWLPKALKELVPEEFVTEKAIRWGLIDRFDTAEDRTLNSGVHCYKAWRSEGWRIVQGGYFLIAIPRNSMKVGKFIIENLFGGLVEGVFMNEIERYQGSFRADMEHCTLKSDIDFDEMRAKIENELLPEIQEYEPNARFARNIGRSKSLKWTFGRAGPNTELMQTNLSLKWRSVYKVSRKVGKYIQRRVQERVDFPLIA